jgi:Fe2+ or Zn2+ uptake regulation protein
MNIQELLMEKLKVKEKNSSMTPKEKTVLSFIENRPGTKSSEISKNLNIPLPTVKRMLNVMVKRKLVSKYGVGSGTNYVVENQSTTKTGLMFQLTNTVRKKEFTLVNEDSFIEISKIILTPLFKWEKPDDWSKKLIDHGLSFKIISYTNKGGSFSDSFPLISFNNPMYYEPKLNLVPTISIPESITMKVPKMNEFPIRILIELMGSVSQFEFDVMFVYNERNSK